MKNGSIGSFVTSWPHKKSAITSSLTRVSSQFQTLKDNPMIYISKLTAEPSAIPSKHSAAHSIQPSNRRRSANFAFNDRSSRHAQIRYQEPFKFEPHSNELSIIEIVTGSRKYWSFISFAGNVRWRQIVRDASTGKPCDGFSHQKLGIVRLADVFPCS